MESITIQILVVNTGATPIHTEKHVFTKGTECGVKEFILSELNRLGKTAHVLAKLSSGKFFVCDHTARKGASKEYFKHEVKYHPYMKELA
jgi:hypothetical protein